MAKRNRPYTVPPSKVSEPGYPCIRSQSAVGDTSKLGAVSLLARPARPRSGTARRITGRVVVVNEWGCGYATGVDHAANVRGFSMPSPGS
jgi:hypothetical protein